MPRKRPRYNPPEYELDLGPGVERTSIRLPEGTLDLLDEALPGYDCGSRNALIAEILVEGLENEAPFDEE